MKFSKLILALSFISISFAAQAQVGIGTNTPDASAQLEVSATNKGLLIPQIALTGSTDATTITNPAPSLLVYNTAITSDVVKGYYYNSGTSGSPVWLRLNTGNSGVPYSGASGAVDLGAYDLKVNGLIIGRGANQSLTTNTAIGSEALADALTADYATAVGFKALNKNSGGFSYGNSAFGAQALLNNQNGPRNTAIGFSSLERNIEGSSNTAVGVNSLYAVVNGGNNTAVGDNTLYINTGSKNTAIGASADVSSASLTNATAIGFDAKVGASNSIQLGDANVTLVNTSGAISAGAGTSTVNGTLVVGATSATGSKAVLEASSTTQGFLPPRMTNAQKNAINNPPAGLILWCTNCGPNGEVQVYNGSAWTNFSGAAASVPALSVGDSYQGGKVAYILQSGDAGYDANVQHGLIVAASDQSTSMRWNNGSNVITGATSTGIGTGLANTDAIILNQASGSYAAKLCRDYNGGGFTDWYLPSKDELNKLYINKIAIGGIVDSNYWSSSEVDGGKAWLQIFSNGSFFANDKGGVCYVRAVRSF